MENNKWISKIESLIPGRYLFVAGVMIGVVLTVYLITLIALVFQ